MEPKKENKNFPEKKIKEDHLIQHPERTLYEEDSEEEETEFSKASKAEIQSITQIY